MLKWSVILIDFCQTPKAEWIVSRKPLQMLHSVCWIHTFFANLLAIPTSQVIWWWLYLSASLSCVILVVSLCSFTNFGAVLSFQDLSCWLTLSRAHNLVTSAVWSVQLCLETWSIAWNSSSLWGVSGTRVGSLCKSRVGFFSDWLTNQNKLVQASSKPTALSGCICKASSRAATKRRSGLRGRSPKGSGSRRMSHSKHPSLPRSVEMKGELAARARKSEDVACNQRNRGRGRER